MCLLDDTRETRVPLGFLVLIKGFKKNANGNSRIILLEFKRQTKQSKTSKNQSGSVVKP